MRLRRMPTTIILMVCSWLIAILGLFIGGFYCLSSLKIGIGIIFASIILAAVVRMFGNIGEIIFNLNANFLSVNKSTDQILSNLTQTLNDNFQSIREILGENFQNIQQNLQQINSDSRDINQNIHNIWLLFENIKNTLEK